MSTLQRTERTSLHGTDVRKLRRASERNSDDDNGVNTNIVDLSLSTHTGDKASQDVVRAPRDYEVEPD